MLVWLIIGLILVYNLNKMTFLDKIRGIIRAICPGARLGQNPEISICQHLHNLTSGTINFKKRGFSEHQKSEVIDHFKLADPMRQGKLITILQKIRSGLVWSLIVIPLSLLGWSRFSVWTVWEVGCQGRFLTLTTKYRLSTIL